MAQPQRTQALSKEGRNLLATTTAVKLKRVKSQRRASDLYHVSRTTIQRRLKGIRPKHETTSVNLELSLYEEQSLVQWILDLDRSGFPHIIDVRRMADALLQKRGQNPPPLPVGKNWATRFV
jgi:hypothetical protein